MKTSSKDANKLSGTSPNRACVVCGTAARELEAHGVNVVTITPQLYIKLAKKSRMVAMCKGSSVCVNCLALAAIEDSRGRASVTIGRAIVEAVKARYNAIVDGSTK